jgi:group I intron endonuclease
MNSIELDSEDIMKIINKKFLINEWRDITQQKVSGIYKIVNKINGKYYVGSSKEIFERWNSHLRSLEKGQHHSNYLQKAWNKYKSINFTFEIIELISDEKLKEVEQVYLDKAFIYENGESTYNASPNSTGGSCLPEIIDKIKSHWTTEKRKKHSEKYIGIKNPFYKKTHSDEVKKVLSKKHSGKKLTATHCQNIKKATMGIKNPFYGKRHTDETKKRMSECKCGKKIELDNPNADLTIYNFFNKKTNEIFVGTRIEFVKKYSIKEKNVYGIISKRVKQNRSGWTIQ